MHSYSAVRQTVVFTAECSKDVAYHPSRLATYFQVDVQKMVLPNKHKIGISVLGGMLKFNAVFIHHISEMHHQGGFRRPVEQRWLNGQQKNPKRPNSKLKTAVK